VAITITTGLAAVSGRLVLLRRQPAALLGLGRHWSQSGQNVTVTTRPGTARWPATAAWRSGPTSATRHQHQPDRVHPERGGLHRPDHRRRDHHGQPDRAERPAGQFPPPSASRCRRTCWRRHRHHQPHSRQHWPVGHRCGTLTFTPSTTPPRRTSPSGGRGQHRERHLHVSATGYPAVTVTVTETSSGGGGGRHRSCTCRGTAAERGGPAGDPAGRRPVWHRVRVRAGHRHLRRRGRPSGRQRDEELGDQRRRVPLNEACWNGESYVTAAYAGTNYINAIKSYVSLLNANGLVAILDLHWTTALTPGRPRAARRRRPPARSRCPTRRRRYRSGARWHHLQGQRRGDLRPVNEPTRRRADNNDRPRAGSAGPPEARAPASPTRWRACSR